MRLGMRMGLNSRQLGGTRLDPDAKLYIAAVEAALGATIGSALPDASRDPKKIISDFYVAERDDVRYSLHKRIFLPIYNNLAANAVDAITTTSGTFPISGSVTVAPGYVQGNGTTGYFDFGVTPSALGITTGSGSLFGLCLQAPSGTTFAGLVSSFDSSDANRAFDLGHSEAGQIRFTHNSTSANLNLALARASQVGIFIGSRSAGSRYIYRRQSSGFSTPATSTSADAGTVPTTKTIAAMRSQFGTGSAYSDGQYGIFGVGLGLTPTQAEGYSLNLKNLWENLTGLALP